jgi:hypothetical protein
VDKGINKSLFYTLLIFGGGEVMDTKRALMLLAKLNDNKDKVLEIAKSYVADMLSMYHSVESYSLVKDGKATPFAEIAEFAKLRKNVAKIESATDVIEEFFMIKDDIAKLKEYTDSGLLIYYEPPKEEPKPEPKEEPKAEEPKHEEPKKQESATETKPAKEATSEKSASRTPVMPSFSSFGSNKSSSAKTTTAKATEEVKTETKPKEEPVKEDTHKEEPADEPQEKTEFVGITKIDTEDNVKALVGYAEGDNYENPYETVYEDDVVLEEQMPTAVKLFNTPPKTSDEDLIAEARMVIDEGKNYIYTGSNPSAYLNKRFEYYRIKYALKNIDDGGEPEPEIEIIKSELDKIRAFETRNSLISIQLVEYDMALVEKVYGLLKEFDEKLYPPEALPNIDRLRELMDSLSDYDEKASLLTKFYRFDVVNFLKTVYTTCSSLEVDKDKRLSAEKDRLEKESFDEIMALEKEYYNSRQGLMGKLGGGKAKSSYETKKKALEAKMNSELEELEKEITEIVERDLKMVGKNMKLYARIDKILKNNVLCFKSK